MREPSRVITLLVILLILALAHPRKAQADGLNFGALDEGDHRVSLTAGAEHGLGLGAAYARVTSFAGRELVLSGDLTLGWAEVDANDFKLRGVASAPLVERGRWKVVGALAAQVRGTKNAIARMVNAGVDATLLAGRYTPRWFAAAELGYDWAVATHIDHTDGYRMAVYADARDGWYRNTGGNLRYGLQGGVSFGRNDVILRAGKQQDSGGNATMIPFYATLTYGLRW
jgi:hypothetical protein